MVWAKFLSNSHPLGKLYLASGALGSVCFRRVPGFLRCRTNGEGSALKIETSTSRGFEPFHLVPGTQMPSREERTTLPALTGCRYAPHVPPRNLGTSRTTNPEVFVPDRKCYFRAMRPTLLCPPERLATSCKQCWG